MEGEKEKVCVTGAGGFAASWVVKLLLSQDYLVHGTVRQQGEKEKVCVTGAGGFAASWVVKLLLSQDYLVHGTVRQQGDSKYDHLNKLEKASENLKLFKADLLDYESLCSAFLGCSGVFHVASPVPIASVTNPEAEIFEPAVKGTLNVLNACLEAKVKRVVVVSSTAAVVKNPNWPNNQVKDESCWSDPEYIKTANPESMSTAKKWYHLSKTQAESEALEFGKGSGLGVVTVCPSTILGPVLQSTLTSSSWLLPRGLKGGFGSFGYNYWTVVDVRDLAEALLLVYKKSEAGERYICTSHAIGVEEVVEKYLKTAYPNYNYSDKLSHTEEEEEKLSSEKLQRLGWTYRPLEETLIDSVENFRKIGVLE